MASYSGSKSLGVVEVAGVAHAVSDGGEGCLLWRPAHSPRAPHPKPTPFRSRPRYVAPLPVSLGRTRLFLLLEVTLPRRDPFRIPRAMTRATQSIDRVRRNEIS